MPDGRQFDRRDLRQTAQRPFRRPVGAVVRERADRTGAAGVHDRRAVGVAQMRQRGLDAEERTEAVDPPAALETRRRLVSQRRAMQHTGVVDQRGERAEPVDHRGDRALPLARPRSRRVSTAIARSSPSASTVLRDLVGEQIARRDRNPSCEQPCGDRRALSAGGAGDERDAIVAIRSTSVSRCGTGAARSPAASARCAAAPRRRACDSEARVIIRNPFCAMVFPIVPVLAWTPATSPASAAACWIRWIASSTSCRVQRLGGSVPHRDRQVGGAHVDAGEPVDARRSRRRRRALVPSRSSRTPTPGPAARRGRCPGSPEAARSCAPRRARTGSRPPPQRPARRTRPSRR